MYNGRHDNVSPLQLTTHSSAQKNMKRKYLKIPFTSEKHASILDFFPKERKEKIFGKSINASKDQDGNGLDLTPNDLEEADVEQRERHDVMGQEVSVELMEGSSVNTGSDSSFIISKGVHDTYEGTKDSDGNGKHYRQSKEKSIGDGKKIGQTNKKIENDFGKSNSDDDKILNNDLQREGYSDSSPSKNSTDYVNKGNKKICEEHSQLSKSRQSCLTTEKHVLLDKEVTVNVQRLEDWYPMHKVQSLTSSIKPAGFLLGTDISQKLRNSILTPRTINRDDMKSGIVKFLRKSTIQDNTYCGMLPSVLSCDHYPLKELDSNCYSNIRELSIKETSYYECCLDHHLTYREDGIISQGIDTLRLCITSSTYPPVHIMGNLLKMLVFEVSPTLM